MTDYLKLTKGDFVEPSAIRRVVSDQPIMRGGVPACAWYALQVAPGAELAKAKQLARDGVYAFCPTETRVRFHRGNRIENDFPIVTQIIYARFRKMPHWDVLKDRKIITGVFAMGGVPIIFPKDIIRSLQGLPTSSQRIAAAKAELLRVNVGEVVKLIDGPMAGLCVDVTHVRGGRVWWMSVLENGFPIKGECDRDGVAKQYVA